MIGDSKSRAIYKIVILYSFYLLIFFFLNFYLIIENL